MKSIHRPHFIVLALIAILLIPGCGQKQSANTPGSDIKIGFLVKMPEEVWFRNEWKFARQCADKYGFELKTIGTPDGEKVLSAIDNLAAQGAQGFVICTPNVKLGPSIVARAKANNLKVFSVDDEFIGADGKPMKDVPYMGISAREIGRMVGRALYDEFKKRGWDIKETAACGITYDELDTARERTEGAIEALIAAGFPRNKIYKSAEKTTDIPGANDAGNIILTQHPEVKKWLVFSMNDEGVLGAVRAMEQVNIPASNVIGVGIGGSSCLVEFRKPKPTGFYATVLISPKRHGYETTEHLYKWIKYGTKPPMRTLTSGILITRQTYSKIMKEQGLL